MYIRAINTAKSAYASISFPASSLDVLRLHETCQRAGIAQTSVLCKHFLASLRTQGPENLKIFSSPPSATTGQLKLELKCRGGAVHKSFTLYSIEDTDFLTARADKDDLSVHLMVSPKGFGRLLNNFSQGQLDICITSRAPNADRDDGGKRAKRLVLRSYGNPGGGASSSASQAAVAQQALQTQMEIDTEVRIVCFHVLNSSGSF